MIPLTPGTAPGAGVSQSSALPSTKTQSCALLGTALPAAASGCPHLPAQPLVLSAPDCHSKGRGWNHLHKGSNPEKCCRARAGTGWGQGSKSCRAECVQPREQMLLTHQNSLEFSTCAQSNGLGYRDGHWDRVRALWVICAVCAAQCIPHWDLPCSKDRKNGFRWVLLLTSLPSQAFQRCCWSLIFPPNSKLFLRETFVGV